MSDISARNMFGDSLLLSRSEVHSGLQTLAELETSGPAMELSNPADMNSLVRPANCKDGDSEAVANLLNAEHGCCASQNSFFGTLIPSGHIGIISHRGRIEAMPEGRWVTLHHRVEWRRSADLSHGVYQCDTATIVRVTRGNYGIAMENGKPFFLGEGLHVYNMATFKFDRFVPQSSQHVQHATLNILRVPKGFWALVDDENAEGGVEPKLLPEGMHVTDSALFKYHKMASMSDTHISHGNLHLIQVQKGWVAKVSEDQMPYLLGEGIHWRNSTTMHYTGLEPLSASLIQHGTITRFRVQKGQVALAWHLNEPVLIQEAGDYQFDTPSFIFEKFSSVQDPIIELGAQKIVTVRSGEVGISYDHGELKILSPGRHCIGSADHIMKSFWSTQQRSMRLASTSLDSPKAKVQNAPASDLLVCETKDFIRVGIRADVFFAIEDPHKAMIAVGQEATETLVRETSIATLTNIIRSTALGEMSQSKQPNAQSEHKTQADIVAAQATGETSAPLFFDRAHDSFLAKLHDDFIQRYGINVSNIRIESFKIMDDSLAESISRQAVATAQTQSSLANLEGETRIATVTKERDAEVRRIEAEAASRVLKMETEAQNSAAIARAEAAAHAQAIAMEREAEAAAQALLAKAKAEAEATRIKAEADAHAIEVCAKAEAERAELIGKTEVGRQLALLEAYSGMVIKANEGIDKVVYMDPNVNKGPLGLMSLQNLGGDLNMLQNVGKTPALENKV